MQRKLERTAVLIFLFASPLWFPTVSSHLSAAVRVPLVDGLTPLLQGVQEVRGGFRDLVVGVFRGSALLSENRVLRNQINLLAAHEETHQILSQENARLRELLRFQEQAPWTLIPAQVIGRDYSVWSKGILLNRGTRDGVRVGQAVITPVGLVGRVAETGLRSCRVILIGDPHFRVSAVLSRGRVAGLVAGTGSGECQLNYLPSDVTLDGPQTVVTAGGSSFCPEGIPIGVVQSVSSHPSELSRSARVKPAVVLSAVEEVLVIRWSGPDSGY